MIGSRKEIDLKSVESLLSFYNIFRPIIDVGILAFILYKAYRILVKTNGIQIIKAAVIVLLSYALAILLNLDTLLWLLNLAAPVLIVGFAIGIANGMGIVVARHFGAGDIEKIKKAVAGSIVIGSVLSLAVMLVGGVWLYGLLRLVHIPENIINEAYSYIYIYLPR